MALYRDGSEPSEIYRGDQPVQAVYRGDTEVWSAADRYDYLESGVLNLLDWSEVEYVIVAGGGGGGGSTNSIRGAGGGGAGGVLTGTVTLPPGTYPVSVGAGGAGGAGASSGTSGGNSTFAGMVAIGGGGSHWAENGGGRDGQPGGSGAGGSAQAGQGGAGTPGQGHPGGTATGAGLGRGGAGGGGAGGPGQDGQSNAPGLGGAGISVGGRTYAAGGRGGHTGGGGTQNPGDGGQGAYGIDNGWDGAGGAVALKVRGPIPVVTITGTSSGESRDQFRQACIDYGTTYDTVKELPFALDTSGATEMVSMFHNARALTAVPSMDTSNVTNMSRMFDGCSSLRSVGDMDTSNVTSASRMFFLCTSLTDGNVRLIGKHPSVSTADMISVSGLTREPWYNADGSELEVITVTPQAPTFLTESPWYTLPTVEGITYTVSGTPGYSQTVTVTATAQAGYALTGQTSWTHTYPSAYPQSGTWQSSLTTSATTYASHTIAESGTYTITHSVDRIGSSGTLQAFIQGPWGTTSGSLSSSTSTASTTRTLTAGNVINFQALRSIGPHTGSGSWSIVKN